MKKIFLPSLCCWLNSWSDYFSTLTQTTMNVECFVNVLTELHINFARILLDTRDISTSLMIAIISFFSFSFLNFNLRVLEIILLYLVFILFSFSLIVLPRSSSSHHRIECKMCRNIEGIFSLFFYEINENNSREKCFLVFSRAWRIENTANDDANVDVRWIIKWLKWEQWLSCEIK